MGIAGGLNAYVYAAASPLRFTDPFGLQAVPATIPGFPPVPLITPEQNKAISEALDALCGKIGVYDALENLNGLSNVVEAVVIAEARRQWDNSIFGHMTSSGSNDTPNEAKPDVSGTPNSPNPNDYDDDQPGKKIIIGPKVQRQMGPRGWTRDSIHDAIRSGEQIRAINKANGNPATRYVHPTTGQSVVVDDVTGEVIHVGGPGFRYGPGSGDVL
jgi:hypothetical protein